MGNSIKQKLQQRGDTIVEVMFALAVIGLTMGLGYGIANRAIITGRDAQERSETSKFIEAQLEKVIVASSSANSIYFDPFWEAVDYCIDDTLAPQLDSNTPCVFGPGGRYRVTINREGNVFSVTGEWQNIRSGYDNTATMVYRTYEFSNTVLLPPPPTPPSPPPPPPSPSPSIGVVLSSTTIASATITGNVSGNPTSMIVRYWQNSIPATIFQRNVNISASNFTVTVPAFPNVQYTYELIATNTNGSDTETNNTFTTRPVGVGYSKAGEYNGHHYYVFNSITDWQTARILAGGKEGHLVTITSAGENSAVANFAPLQSGIRQATWIGFTDESSEGIWRWITGEPVSYTAWGTGEPNNSTAESPDGQNYALTNWSALGSWDDQWYYQNSLSFIVEYDGP